MSYYKQSQLHWIFKDIVMNIYKHYGYDEFTFGDAKEKIEGYDISIHRRFIDTDLIKRIKVPYRAHKVKLNINVDKMYK